MTHSQQIKRARRISDDWQSRAMSRADVAEAAAELLTDSEKLGHMTASHTMLAMAYSHACDEIGRLTAIAEAAGIDLDQWPQDEEEDDGEVVNVFEKAFQRSRDQAEAEDAHEARQEQLREQREERVA